MIIRKWMVVFLLFTFISCSESDNGLNGKWSGLTSQDRPIGFTISGNQITRFNLSYMSSDSNSNVAFNYPVDTPSFVSEDSLSFIFMLGQDTFMMDGIFLSNDESSGTVTMKSGFRLISFNSTLTWTAKK